MCRYASHSLLLRLHKAHAYNVVVLQLDIDECAMNSTLCDQMCVNTFGSYMCTCHSGFRLNNISNQCEGIPLTKIVALVVMV